MKSLSSSSSITKKKKKKKKKRVVFKKRGKGAVEMKQKGHDQKQRPGNVCPGCPPTPSLRLLQALLW
jgi:TPP-dependent indolepyruvate ferredoxin oxidoreductase alpha subunit